MKIFEETSFGSKQEGPEDIMLVVYSRKHICWIEAMSNYTIKYIRNFLAMFSGDCWESQWCSANDCFECDSQMNVQIPWPCRLLLSLVPKFSVKKIVQKQSYGKMSKVQIQFHRNLANTIGMMSFGLQKILITKI